MDLPAAALGFLKFEWQLRASSFFFGDISFAGRIKFHKAHLRGNLLILVRANMLRVLGGLKNDQTRDVMISVQKYLSHAFNAWALVVLVLSCAAIGVDLVKSGSFDMTFFGGCFVAFALIVLAMVKGDRLSMPRYAGPAIIGLILLSVGGWVAYFDSGQVSDFGIYYRCGVSQHADLRGWLDNCQSAYLIENSTYWLRSYFYSSAIGQVFGGGYDNFKVANAILHMLTIVCWFYGVKSYYDVRIATLSSLLLALYPEYWFTSTLVTTDNFAVLCVALFVLIAPKLQGRMPTVLIYSVILGGVVFLGHQLRSIGSIFVISLAFYIICEGASRRNYAALFFGFISISVFMLLTKLFLWMNPSDLPDLFSPMKILSAIDFHTVQGFNINYVWGEHFWVATPAPMQLQMALYKISTEFSGGFSEWPAYFFRKAAIVFSGTGYYGLSSFAYPPDNPDSLVTNVVSNIPFSAKFFPWLTFLVFAYVLAAVVGIFRAGVLKGASLVSLMMVGAFGLLVLGMGESQARYSTIIAPALSLLAALAFFSPEDKDASQKCDVQHWKKFASGMLSILVLYLVVLLLTIVLPTSEKYNANVSVIDNLNSNFGSCSKDNASVQADYKKIRVSFVNEAGCAALRMAVPVDTKLVSFYLSGSRFPYRFEGPGENSFAYELIAKDKIVSQGEIGKKSVSLVKMELPQGTEGDVVLLVKKLTRGADAYLDISLLRETGSDSQ